MIRPVEKPVKISAWKYGDTEMKVSWNREIVVGLSVLLLLVVILVTVTVRRFTRPAAQPDTLVARLEERQGEKGLTEVEARRPTFADPVAVPDGGQESDKAAQWDVPAKEHHEDKPVHALDAGRTTINVSCASQPRES